MVKSLLVLLCLIPSFNYAQDASKPILYLNEELKQIDELTYSNKVLKSIYREDIVKKDSLTIKRLRKAYDFGSFNETELLQGQKLLHKYLNIKDFDRNIIFAYRDSLLGYLPYKNSIQHRKKLDEFDVISEKEYLKRRKQYDVYQKKCKKFAKINNTSPIYIYSENVEFTFKTKHHTKQKIPNILKSIFFENLKYGHVILKPNGQFFYYSFLTQAQTKKMLESDWEPFIKDFNSVKSNSKKYSLEFIDKMYKDFERSMREQAMRRIKQIQKERAKSKNLSSPKTGRITPPHCYTHASY